MKASLKSLLFILMTLSLTTYAWANPQIEQINEKQTKAIQLINAVGSLSNERFSNEIKKEDAEFAYNGFIARFQGIREDREALERKEIMADNNTLENCSQRLDALISDLQHFINR